jgi:hypothetical protein
MGSGRRRIRGNDGGDGSLRCGGEIDCLVFLTGFRIAFASAISCKSSVYTTRARKDSIPQDCRTTGRTWRTEKQTEEEYE